MSNWCEIFRTGKHKDANGVEKEWTAGDLDKIVLKFEEKKPKAPCVIGHPNTNNPAYGWVEAVKREGESLWAKYKDVVPQFAEWVNKGLYPNRSISLYPDYTLRHVGFLGAVPPAIKGLEEFQFSEDQEVLTYNFSEPAEFKFKLIAETLQDLRDFFISKFGLETTDRIFSQWRIDELKTLEDKSSDEIKAFAESLLPPSELAAEPLPAEFSEQLSAKDEEITNLRRQLDDEKAKKRKAEAHQFAEEMLKGGHITPAQMLFVADFMEVCHQQGSFDFSEGDEKSVETRFKEFLKSCKQIEFAEIGKDGQEKTIDFSDPQKAAKEIRALADAKGISVIEAKDMLKKGAK